MESVPRVQIIDVGVYILIGANDLIKSITPSVLGAYSHREIVGRIVFLGCSLVTNLGEGRLNSNKLYSAWEMSLFHMLPMAEG